MISKHVSTIAFRTGNKQDVWHIVWNETSDLVQWEIVSYINGRTYETLRVNTDSIENAVYQLAQEI